jgi:hypothetical protein
MTVLSNAPAGQYTLIYADVPYYTKPGPQTRSLESGATLVFTGNYSFADANTNGMSDAWEQSQFGAVSPDRTALTDTDRDGLTDYAEFIAGTNPKDPQSNLEVAGSCHSNHVALTWFSEPGRSYRIESSTNLTEWAPASAWLRSGPAAAPMTLEVPFSHEAGTLYRVQVYP